MKHYKLGLHDPRQFTLSADFRLGQADYPNDQIWNFELSSGEPKAVSLYTNYGLRARSMRIFPRFITQDRVLADPEDFHQPPLVRQFFPNYLRVELYPLPDIQFTLEYWVPASQTIACRVQAINHSILRQTLSMEWIAQLNSLGEGQGMVVSQYGSSMVLAGQTSDLHPVFYQTGKVRTSTGSFPGLISDLDLFPGISTVSTWICAALDDSQSSFELAKKISAREWDAESSKIEMVNASQAVEITTGDADWNTALALTQKTAASLFFPASQHLPRPSFVLARQPDQGYSMRGTGGDYSHLWNGQNALDAWYLSSLILPGMAEQAAGLVENFLHVQGDDGCIDWKPGMGGQRSKRLAQPIIATLALQISKYLPDSSNWLKKIYPHLIQFVHCWFSPEHDRDQDQYPEWDHPFQSGLDELPLTNPWHPAAQGVEITTLESPSLGAFLYRECQSLIELAQICGHAEDLEWLEQISTAIRTQIDSTWDASHHIYRHRDMQSHLSPSGHSIFSFKGAGTFTINQNLNQPQRLSIFIQTQDEKTRLTTIHLQGSGSDGLIEESITARQISWSHGMARATSQKLYTGIQQVEIHNLYPGDSGQIRTVDYQENDISLLLPLWAGIPDDDHARQLVENCVRKEFIAPHGIPICPPGSPYPHSERMNSALLPWNQLIIEGLLDYQYDDLAVQLISGLMQAIIQNLKNEGSFFSLYHTETGRGLGEKNTLAGLAPIGLFLRSAGIVKITANEVILEGKNNYPWPISVKYRGTKVDCLPDQIIVTFQNGQQVIVEPPGPHQITLERSRNANFRKEEK